MKTGRLITLKMLEDAEACSSQIKEFKERFGDSVKVTKELCLSVVEVFDWQFAARHFLSDTGRIHYYCQRVPLWEEYKLKRTSFSHHSASLWEEYLAVLFWKLYNNDVAESTNVEIKF